MSNNPVGNEWLKLHFKLVDFTLTHASFIGTSHSFELTSRGNVEETYGRKYAVENTPLAHIEFALKYDDLNLDFLKAIFTKILDEEVIQYIAESPAGINGRRIGFLYEFLTRKKLDLPRPVSGNYADLLDEERYITGTIRKDARWRINNNLLGTAEYCPMVRKTKALQELLSINTREKIKDLKKDYEPEVFQRAIKYLYKKETRSSYEIEREEPTPDRMERFIVLLTRGGAEPNEQLVERGRLKQLQNAIVDPRFAAEAYRNFQNYVGASLPNSVEHIHYVCPPPTLVEELMKGLGRCPSSQNRYIQKFELQ